MIRKIFGIFRGFSHAAILSALFAATSHAAAQTVKETGKDAGTGKDVGVVISDGNFQMNGAPSTGSATVTDGSSVITGPAGVSIRLMHGGRAVFGGDSRGAVFGDHLALDQGSARIAGYSATANTLQVKAEGNASASMILVGKAVQVTALTGNVHVYSADGVNVANLVPGVALNILPPKKGVPASSTLTGCVSRAGDRFQVMDETSRVTDELRGGKLSVGEKIRVTGVSMPGEKTSGRVSQVLRVTKVTRLTGTCKALPDVSDTDPIVAGGGPGIAGTTATGAAAATAGIATVATAGVATVGAAAGIGTVAVVAGAAAAAVAGATALTVAETSSTTATLSPQ